MASKMGTRYGLADLRCRSYHLPLVTSSTADVVHAFHSLQIRLGVYVPIPLLAIRLRPPPLSDGHLGWCSSAYFCGRSTWFTHPYTSWRLRPLNPTSSLASKNAWICSRLNFSLRAR
jgi:hypothetical protein